MIAAIIRAFRAFFLTVEHFGHQMDATWAYERGDWDEYVDCQKRAQRCESELLKLRLQA